jgi:hypothetical protein
MDGVLADFDTGYEREFGTRPNKLLDDVDWRKVAAIPDFYLNLPAMPDAFELWSYVRAHGPTILTGIPDPKKIPEAADNKRAWARRIFGNIPIICCRAREKCTHCSPGDILIDDWEKHRHRWVEKGGIWITHTSAASTIQQLRDIGL